MAALSLVVDGGAGLAGAAGLDLQVVPLSIEVSGQILDVRDGGRADEVYARLAAGEPVRTSTPSPGDYLAAFRATSSERILCLTMAGRLSAMHQSASLAARLLAEEGDGREVTVCDTGTAAVGLAVVAHAVAGLIAAEAPVAEVMARLARAGDEVRMLGALRTLRHLARSGRVPAVAAHAGSLLRVRPIFELRSGEVLRRGMVRGDGRLIEALTAAATRAASGETGAPQWLIVCHAAAPELAAELRRSLGAALRIARAETLPLSPVMGAHTGPGMVGLALLPLVGRELEAG